MGVKECGKRQENQGHKECSGRRINKMRYVLKPHMESYCPLNYLKVHFKKKCKRKPLTHLHAKMEKGGFEVPPFLISARQWDIWCLC